MVNNFETCKAIRQDQDKLYLMFVVFILRLYYYHYHYLIYTSFHIAEELKSQ